MYPSARDELIAAFRAGDLRALARALTIVESVEGAQSLRPLFETERRAEIIGITGPPGVGKSTLCASLTTAYRALGKRVGVIAIDPTSERTGGAVLGDRIRMLRHSGDPGVFVRSAANRGRLGGLAAATPDAVALFESFGFDVIVIETIGVGQSEVEIAKLSDTVVVVLQAGAGDEVQMLKAGVLEIADLFVVNKADRGGADLLEAELFELLALEHIVGESAVAIPILKLEGRSDEGGLLLCEAIRRRNADPGDAEQRTFRRRRAFLDRVRRVVLDALDAELTRLPEAGLAVADPYQIADDCLRRLAARLTATS